MDLDRCPKCGLPWSGGDFCASCKFVPIGAGLDKLPKKKKKKNRRYVEPGNSRGLLGVIFIGLSAFGCYKYKPWSDDWELVRALFGQGKHHSLVGEWQVTKAIVVKQDKSWVANAKIQKSTVKFSDKGNVKIDLIHDESETVASGQYEQKGIRVAMKDVRTSGTGGDTVPSVIEMNLAWQGNDSVVAMDKAQAIYLKRKKSGNSLLSFMQIGLRKDAKPDDGKIPGEMRGVIGQMKREASEAEGTGSSEGN
ncbi:MAG: hypothetical protein P4L46_25120 [Fimbriimonas sp.]|nr:hypothetical protein [Fimbriimonas sp.]